MSLVHPPIAVEIFRIGSFGVRWYSLMYIFGFLFWFFWTRYEVMQNRIQIAKNKDPLVSVDYLLDLLSYLMIGVIIFGRLGYVIFYHFRYYFFEDFWAIFRPWEGGMSFHGAFIGAYFAGFMWMMRYKKTRKPFILLDISDVVLVPVPLGLAFGRIGNFINGELYGRPTSVPWGMLFPSRPELGHPGAQLIPIEQVQNILDKTQIVLQDNISRFVVAGQTFVQVPRHPSQLYHFCLEGIVTLMIQMLLYYKLPQSKYRGFLTATFLISYGFSRVFTEFFRQPDSHLGFVLFGWVTIGMLYTIPMVFTGIFLLVWSLSKQEENLVRSK